MDSPTPSFLFDKQGLDYAPCTGKRALPMAVFGESEGMEINWLDLHRARAGVRAPLTVFQLHAHGPGAYLRAAVASIDLITSSISVTSPRSISMSCRKTSCINSQRSPTAWRGTITRKLSVASRQVA